MRKLLWLPILFMAVSTFGSFENQNELIYNQNVFGGLETDIAAEDIPATQSPDLLNVSLDEVYGSIQKVRGSLLDNPVVLPGNQWVRSLYDYKQTNGNEFIVAQSSTSIFISAGDTNYSILVSSVDPTAKFDFTTANNYLYGCNGSMVFKSTGTTVTYLSILNSTGIPTTAKYMRFVNNRMFYAGFNSGDTFMSNGSTINLGPSSIVYSEILDPDNVQSQDYTIINAADGDSITGIYVFQGKLIFTKKFSTWELDETSVNVFQVTNIAQTIGCLYQSTMQTYQGNYPMWLSDQGVVLYDGQFHLISKPIDNIIRNLPQLNTKSYVKAYDTASDWGQGSGINVDTTTYSGSVTISSTNTLQYSIARQNEGITSDSTYSFRQMFVAPTNLNVSQIDIIIGPLSSLGSITLAIGDYVGDYLPSSTYLTSISVPMANLSAGPVQNITIPSANLVANTTYYVYISTDGSATSRNTYTEGGYPLAPSNMQRLFNGTWRHYSDGSVLPFNLYTFVTTATYTTNISTATSWGSWGRFTADETVPANSSITNYVQTSTAPNNLSSRPLIQVFNGGGINSTVGPYIQFIASFSRTSSNASPMVNKVSFSWSGTNNYIPASLSYNNRYYLAVNTNPAHFYNDTVFVYDKNGQWTRLDDTWGSCCLSHNVPYSGSATGGQIFDQDIAGLYSRNGAPYDSYYCTKIFDFRDTDPANTIRAKVFYELWTRTNSELFGTLDLNYRFDGSQGAWTKLTTINLFNASGISVIKNQFSGYPKSQFIQLKFENNTATDTFTFRGFHLPYLVQPRQ